MTILTTQQAIACIKGIDNAQVQRRSGIKEAREDGDERTVRMLTEAAVSDNLQKLKLSAYVNSNSQ